jgi:hypothetical protein
MHAPRATTFVCSALLLAACGGAPRIEISKVPRAAVGGSTVLEEISGKAGGWAWGSRVVLYTKSGDWWVQPYANNPYTTIESGGVWKTRTHLGTDYAALLVDRDYLPPPRAGQLPAVGNGVRAIAEMPGSGPTPAMTSPVRRLEFSGYEWEILYPGSDARVDERGHLHLSLRKQDGRWVGSDVWVRRSLGYGTYLVKLSSPQPLEPATTLRLFTWDNAEAGQNHREMDIEITQWGDSAAKNAQFVVQPYYVPANSFRFNVPESILSRNLEERMHWSPGRVRFEVGGSQPLAEYEFSSGVPTPGAEKFHLSLGVYDRSRQPQRNEMEVVIEKFEFRP